MWNAKSLMKTPVRKTTAGVLAACLLFSFIPVYAEEETQETEMSAAVLEESEAAQSTEAKGDGVQMSTAYPGTAVSLPATRSVLLWILRALMGVRTT